MAKSYTERINTICIGKSSTRKMSVRKKEKDNKWK